MMALLGETWDFLGRSWAQAGPPNGSKLVQNVSRMLSKTGHIFGFVFGKVFGGAAATLRTEKLRTEFVHAVAILGVSMHCKVP